MVFDLRNFDRVLLELAHELEFGDKSKGISADAIKAAAAACRELADIKGNWPEKRDVMLPMETNRALATWRNGR